MLNLRKFITNIAVLIFLAGSCFGLNLHCKFYFTHLNIIGDAYGCFIGPSENVPVDHNVLESVTGEHLDGRSNTDVELLDISYMELRSLPKNLESFFPNLKGIELSNTNISWISAQHLQPFADLLMFSAVETNFHSLDGDLFKFTRKLKWINFSYGKLNHVGRNLLTDLKDLQFAGFEKNPCIDMFAYSEEINELSYQLIARCPPENKTTKNELWAQWKFLCGNFCVKLFSRNLW